MKGLKAHGLKELNVQDLKELDEQNLKNLNAQQLKSHDLNELNPCKLEEVHATNFTTCLLKPIRTERSRTVGAQFEKAAAVAPE